MPRFISLSIKVSTNKEIFHFVLILAKGERDVHQICKDSDKENYTALVTINANGTIAPTMVVFPGEWISKDLADSVPSDWGIRSLAKWLDVRRHILRIRGKYIQPMAN